MALIEADHVVVMRHLAPPHLTVAKIRPSREMKRRESCSVARLEENVWHVRVCHLVWSVEWYLVAGSSGELLVSYM